MKIAHISDLHIRTLRYHDDYRSVFDNLYRKLEELQPDIIVNTGDTTHTKTSVSSEQFDLLAEHIDRTSAIAPYHVILGNHDVNLMNLDRLDALSPVVRALDSKRVHLHKNSGPVSLPDFKTTLWVFSLIDTENYPLPSQWAKSDDVNIGLFHGSVKTCVTDMNWRMSNTEHDLSIFAGLDYVFMGDIHRQQFFKERTIAYAGSLIQQNFGESVDKGFLFWEIADKKKHRVTSHLLAGSRKFYTIKVNDDLVVPKQEIDPDSHVRISPTRPLSLSEQKDLEKTVKELYAPHDVITLSDKSIGRQSASVANGSKTNIENLRQPVVQERLIADFLQRRAVPPAVCSKVQELNRKYQSRIETDNGRNIDWNISKIAWSNVFNYGEGNVIDFSRLGGVTGIFAPNASGKSNVIDVLLETLFDATTRGISRNVHLINDNKEQALMIAELKANDQEYVIERTIDRLKSGQRKGESKEWGKTSCNFFAVDSEGERESLTGMSRPETEKNIRQRMGTYEDMLLTSLSAQWNPLDIIMCKETKRREILFRFLDLDVFDQKFVLAKEDSKPYHAQLKQMDDDGLDEHALRLSDKISTIEIKIAELASLSAEKEKRSNEINEQIMLLAEQKVSIEGVSDLKALQKKIAALQCEAEQLSSKRKKREEELRVTEEELVKLEKLEQRFDASAHEEKCKLLEMIDRELEMIDRELVKKEQQLSAEKKSVKLLQEVPCGDQYPQCRFLVNAFSAKNGLPSLIDEVKSLKDRTADLKMNREGLPSAKEKLHDYRELMARRPSMIMKRDNVKLHLENASLQEKALSADIAALTDEQERSVRMSDHLTRNQEISAEIESKKAEREKTVSELRELQYDIASLNRQLGSEQSSLAAVKGQLDQLKELQDICTAYDHYAAAMGKDGIALEILTQKLPLINEEINKILMDAADFGVIIEHDQDEQSIRIYLQYGEYKPRLIELGSGAEKMLASIALRTALLSISNLPKSNMFIVDEGFGKLDPKNTENIGKMFDYLRTVFDHVLVISHLDILKDMVDNSIELTVDQDGYAHVEVGGEQDEIAMVS